MEFQYKSIGDRSSQANYIGICWHWNYSSINMVLSAPNIALGATTYYVWQERYMSKKSYTSEWHYCRDGSVNDINDEI